MEISIGRIPEQAKEMVRQAKACGTNAIKFRHNLPEEEMLKEDVPMSGNIDMPLNDFLRQHALKREHHFERFDYCKELGIIYLCRPFSRRPAEELTQNGRERFENRVW